MAEFLLLNKETIIKISQIGALTVSDKECSFLVNGIWFKINLLSEIDMFKAYIILEYAQELNKDVVSWNDAEEFANQKIEENKVSIPKSLNITQVAVDAARKIN